MRAFKTSQNASEDRPSVVPAKRRPTVTARLLQLLAVMVASAGLAYGGSAALATRAVHFRTRPLAAAFSLLRHARSADAPAGLREPVGGANATVLAGSFPSGDSVYVSTLPGGDVCLVDQEPAGPAGAPPDGATGLTAVACAHASEAEQAGLSIMTPPSGSAAGRITVLVPDGVRSVVFHDSDGTAIAQAPVNNVAQYVAGNLASATYLAPGGEHVSQDMPTTPPAGSS